MDIFRVIFTLIYTALITIYLNMIVSVVFGCVFTITWNYVIPEVFDLPILTYWQGIAMVFISRILINNSINIKSEPKK